MKGKKLFYVLMILTVVGCSGKVDVNISTPEKALTTILEANYNQDSEAFLAVVTKEYIAALGVTDEKAKDILREAIRKGPKIAPDNYEVVNKYEEGDKVRIEFRLKPEYFDSLRYKLYTKLYKKHYAKGEDAYLFRKTNSGWQAYGRDIKYLNAGGWSYTSTDDRFTILPSKAVA